MDIKSRIDLLRLPKHIAIIMDGNGRWALRRGEERVKGHLNAVDAVRSVTEACAELGVSYLTLYAFSTENWLRPRDEVDALMELLVNTINAELKTLTKNNVRLKMIGDFELLPSKCKDELTNAMNITKNNTGLTLILALSYSSKWEIIQAIKQIAREAYEHKINPDNISEVSFNQYLCTKDFPDPELLIRTSGEERISNFLLWQIAYTELYFTKTLWPDFTKDELYKAILEYQKRERRFGLTTAQLPQQ
jgi:undecaprenyl diphosphate synthase